MSAATHGSHAEAPYQPVFVGASREKLEALFPKYPTKQAVLLPALWIVQEGRGWIPPEGIAEVAAVLGLTPAYVRGVATFYTMYHLHPVGRHFIQVCGTSPCHLCGSDDVLHAILKETGCGELGATSPDGRFTVTEVECLGACGFATPVIIDDDFHDSVTPERVPGILARYP
ncbi:MAG: NAD(P)H-dependent oxidoreductase subunit E [Gemmatimonadetes bacterium]|nr:NAD(P)H-dependent oxidoreductase subunit E [Gemmatimonadota bacterium]